MLSTDQLAWESRAVPALVPPDALAIASIQPTPLEIRPLDTKPVAIAPLPEEIDKHHE
jgi:hypothetical protein